MSQTPTRNSSVKKLPMIVDIAIGNDGKQLYQVHESSKLVRKEMPRSTNFSAQTCTLTHEEEKTPIRKILGTISPSTLNQKKVGEPDFLETNTEPESATRKSLPVPMPTNISSEDFNQSLASASSQLHLHSVSPSGGLDGPLTGVGGSLNAAAATITNIASPKADDNDIWSVDVEAAFEEVLSIIPKNGLSKIKISGRSCGRNELISDYIFQKTGKFRTRKQVSSHIQVIKNLGQKSHIIDLINDGPIFQSKKERIDNMNKFEEIFSKITLAKSMGVSDSNVSSQKRSLSCSNVGSSNYMMAPSKRKRLSSFGMENFYINLSDSSQNFTLSRQGTAPVQNLKLKEDANLSSRFPGLNDLSNLDIPFIHNMVKMKIPSIAQFDNLQSNYLIRTNSPTRTIFSCVYSFGQEVLKSNEVSNFNENSSFMLKFWKFFFKELLSRGEEEINMALKGITIKQIIYETDANGIESKGHLISKSKIHSVLLWEFAAVDSYDEAVTTTSILTIPTPIEPLPYQVGPSYSNEVPVPSTDFQPYGVQPLYGHPKYSMTVPTQGPFGPQSSQPVPQHIAYSPSPSTATTAYAPSTYGRGMSTQPSTAIKSEYGYSPSQPELLKSQVNIQHKFQSLQEVHQVNPIQQYGAPGYLHPSVNMDLMMPESSQQHPPPLQSQPPPLPQQQQPIQVPQPNIHPLDQHHSNPQQMYQFGGLLVNSAGNGDQGGYMNMMDSTYIGK
ncbi:transcription activator Tec1p [[Candida] anglica]|uniref:Transcription activator Tec1p n=1 Tax=[Candida] anglica TaxID=148631 RepID=A0ABP0E7F3_9ASCO